MALYFQAFSGVLLTILLLLFLGRQGKETGQLLSTAVCCMVAVAAVQYLKPVLEFVQTLQSLSGMDRSMMKILLKAVGIGVLSEVAGLVCADAGNTSLGKVVQMLGTAVILWLSIPLFTALIELIQKILGEL